MKDNYEPSFTIREQNIIRRTKEKQKNKVVKSNETYYNEEEKKNLEKLKNLYEKMQSIIRDFPEYFIGITEDFTEIGYFDYEKFNIYPLGKYTLTFYDKNNDDIIEINNNIPEKSHINYADDRGTIYFSEFFERTDIQKRLDDIEELIKAFKNSHHRKNNAKKLSKQKIYQENKNN